MDQLAGQPLILEFFVEVRVDGNSEPTFVCDGETLAWAGSKLDLIVSQRVAADLNASLAA